MLFLFNLYIYTVSLRYKISFTRENGFDKTKIANTNNNTKQVGNLTQFIWFFLSVRDPGVCRVKLVCQGFKADRWKSKLCSYMFDYEKLIWTECVFIYFFIYLITPCCEFQGYKGTKGVQGRRGDPGPVVSKSCGRWCNDGFMQDSLCWFIFIFPAQSSNWLYYSKHGQKVKSLRESESQSLQTFTFS